MSYIQVIRILKSPHQYYFNDHKTVITFGDLFNAKTNKIILDCSHTQRPETRFKAFVL